MIPLASGRKPGGPWQAGVDGRLTDTTGAKLAARVTAIRTLPLAGWPLELG
jgi:hypothetical protein